MSASAASRSTILPLPSSPHCVPTTATVFMLIFSLRPDLWTSSAPGVGPESEPRDIDLPLAEYRSDGAHHARHVAIMQHQEVAFGHGLDPEAVDSDETHRAVADHRAGDLMNPGGRTHRKRKGIDVFGGLARTGLDHADAAFAGDERCVDVVERFVEEDAHQALERGGANRLAVEIGG